MPNIVYFVDIIFKNQNFKLTFHKTLSSSVCFLVEFYHPYSTLIFIFNNHIITPPFTMFVLNVGAMQLIIDTIS